MTQRPGPGPPPAASRSRLVDATLLRDGTVLVLVADVDGGPRSAEVYDPDSGTWTATGPMDPSAEESDGPLTVLQDGRVLLAGREGAQVYDPASGTWTATGPMVESESSHSNTLVLRDGRVLVAGGADAQVYDPASGTWTATGKKNGEGTTNGAAAVLLSDGKVLVAGGRGFRPPNDYYDLDSAEVYDPVTGSWTAIANMHSKAMPMAAFLQPDGKVLVVGSTNAEVYDPATDTWTALPVRPGTGYNTATLLSDGTVLVTGDADQPACTAADLYDPHTGSWTTASTTLGCGPRSLTALLDGTVLAAGGSDCNDDGECGSTGTAELFVPAGVSLPPLPAFPSPPPFVLPSPTPVPTPFPPAAGPVPPNARSWTVTVDNLSSEPATLFVAERRIRIAARRVGDSERGPGRRQRGGDLPLPCRRGMDLREPATGRSRKVGQRGRHRHPRQDRRHDRRPSGLVEPVAIWSAKTADNSTRFARPPALMPQRIGRDSPKSAALAEAVPIGSPDCSRGRRPSPGRRSGRHRPRPGRSPARPRSAHPKGSRRLTARHRSTLRRPLPHRPR